MQSPAQPSAGGGAHGRPLQGKASGRQWSGAGLGALAVSLLLHLRIRGQQGIQVPLAHHDLAALVADDGIWSSRPPMRCSWDSQLLQM